MVDYHPIADPLLQKLHRTVTHLAGQHPLPGGGGAAPLHMAQDGCAGLYACTPLQLSGKGVHIGQIPVLHDPFCHDNDEVFFACAQCPLHLFHNGIDGEGDFRQ